MAGFTGAWNLGLGLGLGLGAASMMAGLAPAAGCAEATLALCEHAMLKLAGNRHWMMCRCVCTLLHQNR